MYVSTDRIGYEYWFLTSYQNGIRRTINVYIEGQSERVDQRDNGDKEGVNKYMTKDPRDE